MSIKNVIYNIYTNKIYFIILSLTIMVIVTSSYLINKSFIPLLEKQMIGNLIHKVKQIANHSSDIFDVDDLDVDAKIRNLMNSFNLEGLHYFSETGEILLSSDKHKIGLINSHLYFYNIVAKGTTYYKIITRMEKTTNKEEIVTPKIEIYIPLMKENLFLGAIEFYFNINHEINEFNQLSQTIKLFINIVYLLIFFIVIV